ncbi:hypothetical protein [Pseudoxanthomonas mexicana]
MSEPETNIVAETVRGQLDDIGDGLSAQFAELQRDCTAERCERLVINLRGAQSAVLRLREALEREGRGDGQ